MTACATHPEVEAIGTCHRCGRFYCAADERPLDGQKYCVECAARDDVDWLGAWARKQEGKRSGLVRFLALVGGPLVLAGVLMVVLPEMQTPQRVMGSGLLLEGVVALLFFAGVRQARLGLLISGAVVTLLFFLAVRDPVMLVIGIPFLGLGAAAWTDVPTKLFLRLPVPRPELLKHFQREGSNPLAVTASRLAFVSLIVPGLGLVAMGMGILAWSRVNPEARPPIGNKRAAITAVFFAALSTLWWASILFRF